MNKKNLIDAAREHFLLSFLSKYDMSLETYRELQLDQDEMGKTFSELMSLGAHEKFFDALKEIMDLRYLEVSPTDVEFDNLVQKMRDLRKIHDKQIMAYRKAYGYLQERFEKGDSLDSIMEVIKAMIPLDQGFWNS